MITVQENKRNERSPQDPFDQQQQDVSAFLLDDKSFEQQQQGTSSLLNPQDNEISNDPLTRSRERIPVYTPGSLHGDTLVNDLLLDNGRRGGLIRLEPDAEFIDKDLQQQQD